MEIKVNSKFEIGDIKKLKGSTQQKMLIHEIITTTCSGGTQIFYAGALLIKKDNYGLTARGWQGSGFEKEPPEEWTLDKEIKVEEILLED